MSIVKMKGIVIAENNMGDFDKMLTMLTPGARENFVCSQGSKTPKKLPFGWHTIFMFWRICYV